MEHIWKREKTDLLIALGINLVFLIFYLFFFRAVYESNDDNAMAFFVEGAYGDRTSHLIFENLIWGKILCILSGLVPCVKWYTVGQYFIIFCAFVSLSYVMLRIQGRKIGIVSNVFLLSVFGYNTYIIFQWTRTAAIITIGGMILLFYAIEYAGKKFEGRIALAVGAVLCILGSFIRFEFFAICVVLSAGAGLMRFLKTLGERDIKSVMKMVGIYLAVFGTVGILSVGIWSVDRSYYRKDEDWSYYLEYNGLRGQLWDLGFPDYEENRELYVDLGVSENDLEHYRTWNMDQELMPLTTLRALVDAKDKQALSMELVKNYFKEYPKRFFGYSIFGCFLIVALIAVALKRKNLLLVLYEFIAIMAFEFYFFYIGRYGLQRIDIGMWMAAITAVLYGMWEEKDGGAIKDGRWAVVLAGAVLALNLSIFSENMEQKRTSSTAKYKSFFEMLSADKDNLYLLSMRLEPQKLLLNAYDFWEPAQFGDLTNIYYMGGWEYNVPVKKQLLMRYGVTNIYRDSIDNPDIIIVANKEAPLIERYIQENYDINAGLALVKRVDGTSFWKVQSKPMIIEGKMNTDLSDIVSEVQVNKTDGNLGISGYCYKKDSNSFQQYAYLKLEDTASGETSYMELTMSNSEGRGNVRNGKYSSVSGSAAIAADREYNVSVILQADGELYEISLLE